MDLDPSVNLFLKTRRLCLGAGQSGEDHLTEFVAGALVASAAFREAYVSLTLGRRFEGLALVGVRTQVSYPGAQPDMELLLRDPRGDDVRVIVEHKIDAAETVAQIAEAERGLVGQLERYLEIPGVAGVLYFRRSLREPAANVLGHPLYVRPEGLPHFLWEHLYGALGDCEADSVIVRWLREGFDELGFLPVPAEIGDLYDLDPMVRERNRRALEQLLVPAREMLRYAGWSKVWTDQKGNELKVEGNSRSAAHRITVTGSNRGPFTIRVVPAPSADPGFLARVLDDAYAGEPAFRGSSLVSGDRGAQKVPSVLLEFSSLAAIMRGLSGDRDRGSAHVARQAGCRRAVETSRVPRLNYHTRIVVRRPMRPLDWRVRDGLIPMRGAERCSAGTSTSDPTGGRR